jgi:tRNA A-37 threonylcarbamoyl transferase component Bud32
METSILKRVSKGELKGWVREEILRDLPSIFFDDPFSSIQELKGEIIKESKWRKAAIIQLPNGRRIFLKRDKSKGWIEYIKYLFSPSKGHHEFLIASQLESKNLNIPKPLGWMERVRGGLVKESYFFSEAVGTGISFIDEGSKLKDPISITKLALTVKKFHDAGLFHRDLHAGNFLQEGDSLFLTDLHRTKIIRTLSMKQRLWSLAHLFHSLRSTWGDEDQLEFLSRYFGGRIEEIQKREILHQKIYPMMGHLQKRQWRSRTKRCMKESTEFGVQREKGIRFFYRRDFPLNRLKKAMGKHQTLVQEGPFSLIKCSPEVNVSLLNDGGERICIKQFCYPHFWRRMKEYFRRSKGLKSWLAANGMRVRGLPSLKPLAFVERRNWLGVREGFLFMEALIEDQEMDRYILKEFNGLEKKRLFIRSFTRWLNHLHQMGLYHKDMKTCNILVSERERTWEFHLLDFEDLLMEEKVNPKRLFRNFLQLNTSTPKVITKMDRLRFFKEYNQLNPIVKDQKTFLQRLVNESRRRGLVYVSPQGVVSEKI